MINYVDPKTGKRIRRRFKTKKEALQYKSETEYRFATKQNLISSNKTIGELLNKFIKENPSSRILQPKVRFIAFKEHFQNFKVSEIELSDLKCWYKKMNESYAEITLPKIRWQLNPFFEDLVDRGILQENIPSKLNFKHRLPPIKKRVYLSKEEVFTILDNAKNFPYLYPYLFTVVHTGARRNEVRKLKRQDVDFQTNMIIFRDTKNGTDRLIKMSECVRILLKVVLKSHRKDYVFLDENSNHITEGQIHWRINKLKMHFPIAKDWTIHSLRHSFAYNYLKKEGHMYQLQAILGHKRIQTTIDIYGQLPSSDIQMVSPYED